MTRNATLLLFLLSLVTGSVQAGTTWTVEERSRLGFVATQGVAPVEGVFEKFEAEIAFATGGLANSNVSVEIEMADRVVRNDIFPQTGRWPLQSRRDPDHARCDKTGHPALQIGN